MTIEIKKQLVIEFGSEWKQLKGKYNWLSFTPVHIYFEKDNMFPAYEINITLLGFSFFIRFNTKEGLRRINELVTDTEAEIGNTPK